MMILQGLSVDVEPVKIFCYSGRVCIVMTRIRWPKQAIIQNE